MSRPLSEYFPITFFTDIEDYGWLGQQCVTDFLSIKGKDCFDWIITNPPFLKAEEFIRTALPLAREGVAMFTRLSFLETQGRYKRLFSQTPPNLIAIFSERVPIFRGRVDKDGSSPACYVWLVWANDMIGDTRVVWIPPCRKSLEMEGDYDASIFIGADDRLSGVELSTL